MPDDLTSKVALVTGGSRGIGRGIAVALAEAGADVVVNFRTGEKEARETCAAIERAGRRAVAVQADVSIAADAARLVATVEAELGPVAILVNNAGVTERNHRLDGLEESGEAIPFPGSGANRATFFAVVGIKHGYHWHRAPPTAIPDLKVAGCALAHFQKEPRVLLVTGENQRTHIPVQQPLLGLVVVSCSKKPKSDWSCITGTSEFPLDADEQRPQFRIVARDTDKQDNPA
jgi:hypothetical protein